jgi:hypothetical protein
LVGETDLEFLLAEDRERRGWLIPTAEGEELAEIAAGVSDAMEAALEAYDLEAAAADIAAAVDRRDALELELHGPDGNVIPVARLTIRDTVILMSVGDARFEADDSWYDSLTDEERKAFNASIDDAVRHDNSILESGRHRADDFVDEPPGIVHGLPRYEVIVKLIDDASFPPAG